MLKNRYILVLLYALTLSVSAWGATCAVGHDYLNDNFIDATRSVSWSEDKVTFTLSGTNAAIYTTLGNLYMASGPVKAVGGDNVGATFSLSWKVLDKNYDIAVSKVTINVQHAYKLGSYITVGDGPRTGDLFWVITANVSTGSKVYTTYESIPIVFEKAQSWSTVVVNSVTITYELVPKFIFLGNGGGGESEELKWEKKENWFPKDKLPTINDSVFIRHDVIISESATAKSVIIEKKTMTDELSKVTVAPTGVLKVGAGGVKNATEDNFKLQAGTGTEVGGNGYAKGLTGALLIDPGCTEPMPNATAEMYSKAYFDMNGGKPDNNAGAYQYVGSPMKKDETKLAKETSFINSWIYSWEEATGEWKNNRKNLILEPFVGYCTSQYASSEGILIEHKGQLASNGNRILNLSCTDGSTEKGINVFANSYAAPIDITKFEDGDFSSGVEATIFLFNTGSKNDVAALTEFDGNAAGQFIEIPIHLAGTMVGTFQLPTVIPAMQGFYVKTTAAGTITLNYERLVWNAANANTPLRAKRAEEQKNGALSIAIEADGWRDQVFLLESEEYDAAFENGYDAHKLMSGNLNIFTLEGEDALAVDATNRIAGTKIAVRTGAETAYTLTFGSVSGEAEWSLYDAQTQETVDIEEGKQYTFFAEPSSEIRDRFYIAERNDSPAVTTDLEKVNSNAESHKFIKEGQLFVIKNGLIYNTLGVVVSR